jgi:hypothetical protein
MHDDERVVNRSRSGPRCGGVDVDIVYTDENTSESIELKPEEIDDVENKIIEIFFSGLSVQPGNSAMPPKLCS